ncbi:hypothetical protein ACN94_18665 [Gordonia paraffinivorans]|nr:hypothetical protein [Gordonia paraffinivorans]
MLAGLSAPDADLLLLDEPANHLDAAAPALRTARLREWRCGVVTVGHDRAFPTGDATTFVDLDPGRDGRPAGPRRWLPADPRRTDRFPCRRPSSTSSPRRRTARCVAFVGTHAHALSRDPGV